MALRHSPGDLRYGGDGAGSFARCAGDAGVNTGAPARAMPIGDRQLRCRAWLVRGRGCGVVRYCASGTTSRVRGSRSGRWGDLAVQDVRHGAAALGVAGGDVLPDADDQHDHPVRLEVLLRGRDHVVRGHRLDPAPASGSSSRGRGPGTRRSRRCPPGPGRSRSGAGSCPPATASRVRVPRPKPPRRASGGPLRGRSRRPAPPSRSSTGSPANRRSAPAGLKPKRPPAP